MAAKKSKVRAKVNAKAKARPKAKAKPIKKKVSRKVKPIPAGAHVVTAAFRVPGCGKAIDFVAAAFGAKVRDRYDGPGGVVYHAEMRIGDTTIMCGDPQPGSAETFPLLAMIYVKDSDEVFARALALGATVVRPLQDQFYGDRSGTVRDPSGNEWTISTHTEDVTRRDIKRRMEAMM